MPTTGQAPYLLPNMHALLQRLWTPCRLVLQAVLVGYASGPLDTISLGPPQGWGLLLERGPEVSPALSWPPSLGMNCPHFRESHGPGVITRIWVY